MSTGRTDHARPSPRRARTLAAAVAVVAMAVLIVVLTPVSSTIPYALDNPHPDGAQALAALLREEGIEVRTATSVSQALSDVDHADAQLPAPAAAGTASTTASDRPDVTIALVNTGSLSQDERAELAGTGADLTVIGAPGQDLSALADSSWSLTPAPARRASARPLAAGCADVDATAAETISASSGAVTLTWLEPGTGPGDGSGDGSGPGQGSGQGPGQGSGPGGLGAPALHGQSTAPPATGCFALPGPDPTYAYAVVPAAGGGTLRVIADPELVTNGALATDGHAALAVRALGHHSTLVWVDGAHLSVATVWDTSSMPPWFPVELLALGAVVAVAALARGRRFGPLVTEPLPVLVPATETTRGRGHLYHVTHAREQAAAALRAGTVVRLGQRLGLPSEATAAQVVDAVASASALPTDQIRHALYGPVPGSDSGLVRLSRLLTDIENEVHPS